MTSAATKSLPTTVELLRVRLDQSTSLTTAYNVTAKTLFLLFRRGSSALSLAASPANACTHLGGMRTPLELSLIMEKSSFVTLSCGGIELINWQLDSLPLGPRTLVEFFLPEQFFLHRRLTGLQEHHIYTPLGDLPQKPKILAVVSNKIYEESAENVIPLPLTVFQNETLFLKVKKWSKSSLFATLFLLHPNASWIVKPQVKVVKTALDIYEVKMDVRVACMGAPSSKVEMVVPELLARFQWDLKCTFPQPTTVERTFGEKTLLIDSGRPVSHIFVFKTVLMVALGGTLIPRNNLKFIIRTLRKKGKLFQPSFCPSTLMTALVDATATPFSFRHVNLRPAKLKLFKALATLGCALWLVRDTYPALSFASPISLRTSSQETIPSDPSLWPRISVVTPCYDQAKFLPEVANSLSQQTYPFWEWIVVNDGSPDACLEVALEIQRNFTTKQVTVLNKVNSGLAHSRNVAISVASSPWICLLDADDRLEPTYFDKAIAIIRSDPSITAVNAHQQFFGESDWSWYLPKFDKNLGLYRGIYPVQTIFRKRDWQHVKGFETTIILGYNVILLCTNLSLLSLPLYRDEDWNFWISISHLEDFKLYTIDEFLLFYR